MMRLKKLIENLECLEVIHFQNVQIEGIAYDSRKVESGFLFVCIKGLSEDGHRFVSDAVRRGAAGIVCEEAVCNGRKVPEIVVRDSRSALSHVSAVFHQHPSGKMHVTGITGTNGKTSTSLLCEAILKETDKVCGVIGTISYRWGDRILPAGRTTPESLDTQQILEEMFNTGCRFVLMEVSSHALEQKRVQDVEFKTGIFTNLSAEHLDYHKNMEDYLKAKGKLFAGLGKETTAIVNVDDLYGAEIIRLSAGNILTYGIEGKPEIAASGVLLSPEGIVFVAHTPVGSCEMRMKLLGKGNVYNALAAISFGISVGSELEEIRAGLEKVEGIRGRFEIIWGGDFTVVVDYAHTPQALEILLQSAKCVVSGKIILVFGCGGNRDKTKRSVMGGIAGSGSDLSFITTDNPRSEDPEEIIARIETGFHKLNKRNYRIVSDRKEAIREAISVAEKGDMVIIAGKGHETYQICKDTVIPFDDREVAREVLEEFYGTGNYNS